MHDSAATPAYGRADLALEHRSSGDFLVIKPDQSWINDPARVFPIVVDPTFTTDSVTDEWYDSHLPNVTHFNDKALQVGNEPNATPYAIEKARALMRFNTAAVPDSAAITDATLTLHQVDSDCNSPALEVHKVLSDWDFVSVDQSHNNTWNDPPQVGPALTMSTSNNGATCPNKQVYFSGTGITNAASYWQSNPNYGFQIRLADETNNRYRAFSSRNWGSGTSFDPHFSITYSRLTQPTDLASTSHVRCLPSRVRTITTTWDPPAGVSPSDIDHYEWNFNTDPSNTISGGTTSTTATTATVTEAERR